MSHKVQIILTTLSLDVLVGLVRKRFQWFLIRLNPNCLEYHMMLVTPTDDCSAIFNFLRLNRCWWQMLETIYHVENSEILVTESVRPIINVKSPTKFFRHQLTTVAFIKSPTSPVVKFQFILMFYWLNVPKIEIVNITKY